MFTAFIVAKIKTVIAGLRTEESALLFCTYITWMKAQLYLQPVLSHSLLTDNLKNICRSKFTVIDPLSVTLHSQLVEITLF